MWRLQVNSSICRTYTVNRCRRQLSLVSNAQTPLLPVIVDLSLARTNSQQIEVMEFEQKRLRATTGLDSEEN